MADGFWRDLIVVTWNITTMEGARDKMHLSEGCSYPPILRTAALRQKRPFLMLAF